MIERDVLHTLRTTKRPLPTSSRPGQKYVRCPVLGFGCDYDQGVGVWIGTSGDDSGLCLGREDCHEQNTKKFEEMIGSRVETYAPIAKYGEKHSADEEIRESNDGVSNDIG